MKASLLLKLTAIAEIPIALALLFTPAFLIRDLLGAEITLPFEFSLARISGAAILVLGFLAWKYSVMAWQSIHPLLLALSFYNALVAIFLLQSSIETKRTPLLLVAFLVHIILGTLCLVLLIRRTKLTDGI